MRILTAALIAGTMLATLSIAEPAAARLQLSISVGASTFTCFDGELSCDQSGGANNLLTIDQTIGGAFVEITLAQSQFGKPNILQLSSSNILNQTGAPLTIKLLASDASFVGPVSDVLERAVQHDRGREPGARWRGLDHGLQPEHADGGDP